MLKHHTVILYYHDFSFVIATVSFVLSPSYIFIHHYVLHAAICIIIVSHYIVFLLYYDAVSQEYLSHFVFLILLVILSNCSSCITLCNTIHSNC